MYYCPRRSSHSDPTPPRPPESDLRRQGQANARVLSLRECGAVQNVGKCYVEKFHIFFETHFVHSRNKILLEENEPVSRNFIELFFTVPFIEVNVETLTEVF